jgi:tRNA threonylcarbamoyladenosine biosynthesis protein TsaB
MLYLAIKTDNPEAQLHLLQNDVVTASKTWTAHRQLLETLHVTIKQLLESQKLAYSDIAGIIFYAGPGSFTGLRIGASVANALAASLDVGIVAAQTDDWLHIGAQRIVDMPSFVKAIEPEYGSPATITAPKK